MSIGFIIGICILLALFLGLGGTLPKKYRNRNCMGKNWKIEFPNSSKEDIRKFLLLFTEAFALSENDKLKFEPNDKLLDIYRALYPTNWMADALEFETLADELDKKYKVKFDQIWHNDLTLGELYMSVKTT